jgi:hypothetical protein
MVVFYILDRNIIEYKSSYFIWEFGNALLH